MNQKYKILIGFLVLVSVFSSPFITNASQMKVADAEVVSVAHTPIIVSKSTNVTVLVTFDDDSQVNSIDLHYCSISPLYACHPQTAMTANGSNTWIGSFVVTEESGVIAYQMHISTTMDDYDIPDGLTYLGHDNIIEPSTDTFYFSITLSTPTNQAPLMSWCGAVSSLLAVAVIRIRKRK